MAMLYVGCTVVVAIIMAILKPWQMLAAISTFACGAVAYLIALEWKRQG